LRPIVRVLSIVLALLAVPILSALPASAGSSTQSTGVLNSFDGTPIVFTLFEPAGASASNPVPAILMTHGWSGSRQTTTTGMVGALLSHGYAVLTWDSRGFGQSGGVVELDSPAYEVRDARALIDLLATLPQIQMDGVNDPRVGMTGGSYAGGIQLLTAAFDHRIDAITPDITWNDLRQSLGPYGVPKTDWLAVLFGSGAATGAGLGLVPGNPAGPQAGAYDINLPLWYAEVHATNGLTPDAAEGLRERSPSVYVSEIKAPTLFTQGLPDTLFNANEATATYRSLLSFGVPAKLLLGCFGHSGCPYASDDAHVQAAVLDWLDHYVKQDGTSTGANVEWFANDAIWRSSATWPPVGTTWLTTSGNLLLASTPAPTGGGGFSIGAGGLDQSAQSPLLDDGVGSGLIPIATAGANGLHVAGAGHVQVHATGVGTEAFLFFRLVDSDTGAVLDGQTQAYRMPISPISTGIGSLDLVGVGYSLPAGHHLALQVSTSDFSHATNRQPGVYQLTVDVTVPTL